MKDEKYIWFDHLFLIASFKQDDIKVLAGPALSSSSYKEDLLGVLDQMKISLLKKELIIDELYSSTVVPFAVFQNIKNILEIVVKGRKPKSTALPLNKHTAETIIDDEEITWSQNNMKSVQLLESIVKNGDVKAMKELFSKESASPYGNLAKDELRHFKNSMMIHIYIVRYAAREGGLDEDFCIRLAENYAQNCESAKTLEELYAISKELRLDFCRRVQDHHANAYQDLTINRIINYIHLHRHQKINAKIIADHFDISERYLCHRFKTVTGQSITSFIQYEKV